MTTARFPLAKFGTLAAAMNDTRVAPVIDMTRAALYVHWPYCRKRCTYCNFNKYISRQVDHERMSQCLQKEASTLIRKSPISEITSVFFGGGTPSLALPSTLGAVLSAAEREATLAPNAEVTMEVNPTRLQPPSLADFKAAGVNRVSIGVQTLNDHALNVLGRDHSSKDSLRCLETASAVFEGQTSVDLMFGYPGQSLKMWREELLQILPLCDNHISLYQLTLERGTKLYKDVAAGLVSMPSADEIADMFFAAIEILKSREFEQYEVSNFAKLGHHCRHNLAYWTGQQYLGVGPGSHGRVWFQPRGQGVPCRHVCVQTLEPDVWMQQVEKHGHATRKLKPQTTNEILEELVSVSLRTSLGLLEKNWSAMAPSVPLDELLGSPEVNHWIKEEFLVKTERGVAASPSGLSILDTILPDLLVAISSLVPDAAHLHTPAPR